MFSLELNIHNKKTPTNPIAQILGKYGIFGWLVILIIYNLFLSTVQKTFNIHTTIMTLIITASLPPLLLYQFYLFWFFLTSKKNRLTMTIQKNSIELYLDPKKKPLKTSIKKASYRYFHHYRRKKYTGPSLLLTVPGYQREIIIECKCDFDLIQWKKPEKVRHLFNSGNILVDEFTFIELLSLLKLQDEIKQYKIKT